MIDLKEHKPVQLSAAVQLIVAGHAAGVPHVIVPANAAENRDNTNSANTTMTDEFWFNERKTLFLLTAIMLLKS